MVTTDKHGFTGSQDETGTRVTCDCGWSFFQPEDWSHLAGTAHVIIRIGLQAKANDAARKAWDSHLLDENPDYGWAL